MNPAQLIQNRSVLLIFRDCLKLANRMVSDPIKTQAVRALIHREFAKNRDVIDQEEIRTLKLAAVRAISNYIIHTVREQYNLTPKKTIYDEDQPEDLDHQQPNAHSNKQERL